MIKQSINILPSDGIFGVNFNFSEKSTKNMWRIEDNIIANGNVNS